MTANAHHDDSRAILAEIKREANGYDPRNIVTNCPLQEAILERATDYDGTPEEFADTIRDMASGHDPIYQFVGFIPTHGIVIDLYNEFKPDIVEAIAEIASYGNWGGDREVQRIVSWQAGAGITWNDPPRTHAEFAGRCLKIALDYHAGELASQLDQ